MAALVRSLRSPELDDASIDSFIQAGHWRHLHRLATGHSLDQGLVLLHREFDELSAALRLDLFVANPRRWQASPAVSLRDLKTNCSRSTRQTPCAKVLAALPPLRLGVALVNCLAKFWRNSTALSRQGFVARRRITGRSPSSSRLALTRNCSPTFTRIQRSS